MHFASVRMKRIKVKDEINEILTEHNRSAPIIMLACLYLAKCLM